MHYDLIIIGSGLAAYTLAKEWRKINHESTLCIITQSNGAFYSKPMLSTALANNKTAEDLLLHSSDQMADSLNATIINHKTVNCIDPKKHFVYMGEAHFSYKQCVLATGASPIIPAWSGRGVGRVNHINQWEDYQQFRQTFSNAKTITIIGSGLVGCEFAHDLSHEKHEVHIISTDSYPLKPLVPKPLGEALQHALEKRGIHWHLKSTVQSIDKCGDQLHTHFLTHEKKAQLVSDMVISAVGLRANTHLASNSKILCSPLGILVDRYGQSSQSDIFALGDCASIDGFTGKYVAPILFSSRALAQTLNHKPTIIDFPVMPIVVKTPDCPIACTTGEESNGQWEVQGTAPNLKACFYKNGQLIKFALSGTCTKERMALCKQVKPFFDKGLA